ncbi:MAG: tetratricopeptide repeat protein [Alphaproteobacteria bacterium]
MSPRHIGSRLLVAGLVAIATVAVPASSVSAANDLEDTRIGPEAKADSPFGGYLAGHYARAVGDNRAAAEYLARAIDDDPDNADLARSAYRLKLAAGRVDEAVALARKLGGEEPNDGLAPLVLAIAAIRAGAFQEADQWLDRVPVSGMNILLRPVAKAWVRVGQGQGDQALAELETLRQSEQSKTFRLFHQALIQGLIEQPAEAEAAFRELIDDRATRSLSAVQAFANFLVRAGRRDEAVALIEEYLPRESNSALVEDARSVLDQDPPVPMVSSAAQGIGEALNGAARFMAQNGDRETATIYAQLALYLSPGLDAVHVLLGNLEESAQQWEAAIAAYRAVPPDTPFGWSARLRIAATLHRLDRTNEAMTLLRGMADERPARNDALIQLADILRSEKRWREAADAYGRAIDRAGSPVADNWGLYYSRGIAFERAKRWPEAERDFLQALELQPEQPDVLNYLGYSWVEQGLNLDRARAMLERAVELRPRDGWIIDSLGWVLFQLGDFEGAVLNLERAIALQPADPVVNEHLGDAYWRVGRKREARFQWDRALTFKPEADLVPVIQRKLREGLGEI